MTKLIERNTTIPVRRSENLFDRGRQSECRGHPRAAGERELARDNRTLGHFRLEGIAPAPRGLPQIDVTFDIDANGILTATARDKTTGKEQSITISGTTQLSKEEIDRMVSDAQRHSCRRSTAARKEWRRAIVPTPLPIKSSANCTSLVIALQLHEKARAENMIQEIRQLVKNQSTDIGTVAAVVERPPTARRCLAETGYAQAAAGTAAVLVGMAGQGSAADD